jgi:hypothetical protein
MSVHSIDRLSALKAGQKYVAYIGDFERDIPAARYAPAYAGVLTALRNELGRRGPPTFRVPERARSHS